MILSLKNIGKLKEARIEIDGITVIAGENNTGKSTVGRALFAVFNSFYDVEEQIFYERFDSVEGLLSLMYRRVANKLTRGFNTVELARDIILHQDSIGKEKSILKDKILDFFLPFDGHFEKFADDPVIDEIAEKIQEILNISDDKIFKSVLGKKISVEFKGQINNIFSVEKGEIKLQIKDDSVIVAVENDSVVDVENNINLHTEAVYIDDPLILDDSSYPYAAFNSSYIDHRMHLSKKLFLNDNNKNVIEEIIVNNKFERIYDKISTVCSGEVVKNKPIGYGYRRTGSDKLLDVRNLSTGLKTFAILKTLLINGTIEYNGTIILDEPEIHLHPEWQLLFAELIIMLHKEFGVHILLNTHSPYFLRALQVYSAKYEVAEKCKYYLSEQIENQVKIEDVSNNIERIYAKLSKPLQDLEDERWGND